MIWKKSGVQRNLPESDVPLVGSALGVLVDGVSISTRLVTHDALAVSLMNYRKQMLTEK